MAGVEGRQIPFLVDTGATRSALKDLPSGKLSTTFIPVVGFSGIVQNMPLSTPLRVSVGHQELSHSFLSSPDAPMNLMGRDLLIKLGATILCSPDGLIVTMPTGESINCSVGDPGEGNYLMMANPNVAANIYWALLDPETPTAHGLLRAYLLWKPFLQSIHPYLPPPDPPTVPSIMIEIMILSIMRLGRRWTVLTGPFQLELYMLALRVALLRFC